MCFLEIKDNEMYVFLEYLEKGAIFIGTSPAEFMQSKICMRSLFFPDRRAFTITEFCLLWKIVSC